VAIEGDFTVVLRGYDVKEVDALVRDVDEALASDDVVLRTSVGERLRRAAFRVSLRGYDRGQVDDYLRRTLDLFTSGA
jgi:DivIVA domain-containing protein